MRKQGTIVRWEESRGFGFIQSPASSAQLFVHIRDWRGSLPPTPNQRVSFEEIHVGGKGPRAMDVRPADQTTRPAGQRTPQRPATRRRAVTTGRREAPAWPAFALMLVWAGLLVAGVVLGRLAWVVLPAAFVFNLVTFFVYWQDKFAATRGAWRTAENTLHLFGLAGGWPGAWFAHRILRHKSAKQAFRDLYWVTAVLNVMALGAWVALPWLPLSR